MSVLEMVPGDASGLCFWTMLPRTHCNLQTWLPQTMAMPMHHAHSHRTSDVTHLFSITHTAYLNRLILFSSDMFV